MSAQRPARRWQEMTTRDFAEDATRRWIAVLPTAAIEQHGPHLPVATHTAIAEGMIATVLQRVPDDLPVTVLPVQARRTVSSRCSPTSMASTRKTWRVGRMDKPVTGEARPEGRWISPPRLDTARPHPY